jgi:hypothetical protein
LRHFGAQAAGAGNDALGVRGQKIVVDARLVIVAVDLAVLAILSRLR